MFRREFILTSFLSFFGIKTKIPNGLNEIKIENGEILNGEELLGDEPFRIEDIAHIEKDGKWTDKVDKALVYRSKKVWLSKKDAMSVNGLTQLLSHPEQLNLTWDGRIVLGNRNFHKFYGEVLLFQLLFFNKEGNYSRFYIKPMLDSIFIDMKLESNKKKYNFKAGWVNVKQIPNEGIKELALEEFFN